MGNPIDLESAAEPAWQWPESGPPKDPSTSNVYWWEDSLSEDGGDGKGTAMIRGLASGYRLECEGWIMVKSDRGRGRLLVEGYLGLTDGVIEDGALQIVGGTGSFQGHAGKTVTVTVVNPKRYSIPD